MKINLSTDELFDLVNSGKLSEEARKTLAGAIISVIMSDEATVSVVDMVVQKAEIKAAVAIDNAVRVRAASYRAPEALEGYLAADILKRLSTSLDGSLMDLINRTIEKMIEQRLTALIYQEVDRSVRQEITALSKGELSRAFMDKVSDEYLDEAVGRVIKKKLGGM